MFNCEIKKSVAKGYHQNLKEAFDSALAAERKAKKFKGLTDDDPLVMVITARRQVNQVMATSENEHMPGIADLNQTAVNGTQPTNAKFSRQKFHTNCYKCGERGQYARECPQSLAAKQIVLSPGQPPITHVVATQMDTSTMQMIPTVGPSKVVQTITSEGQLPMGAWNTLLEQLGQVQAENKQMKKFVKKYVPFKKRNTQDQRQSTKQQKNAPHTKPDDDKGPKVNKIEVHNEPDDDEEYLLWNLHMANNEDTEPEEHDSDNEVPSPQINAILTGNGMASKFPAKFGTYSTICLFDSGASHPCVSYRCFKSAYPSEIPNTIDGIISLECIWKRYGTHRSV